MEAKSENHLKFGRISGKLGDRIFKKEIKKGVHESLSNILGNYLLPIKVNNMKLFKDSSFDVECVASGILSRKLPNTEYTKENILKSLNAHIFLGAKILSLFLIGLSCLSRVCNNSMQFL